MAAAQAAPQRGAEPRSSTSASGMARACTIISKDWRKTGSPVSCGAREGGHGAAAPADPSRALEVACSDPSEKWERMRARFRGFGGRRLHLLEARTEVVLPQVRVEHGRGKGLGLRQEAEPVRGAGHRGAGVGWTHQ